MLVPYCVRIVYLCVPALQVLKVLMMACNAVPALLQQLTAPFAGGAGAVRDAASAAAVGATAAEADLAATAAAAVAEAAEAAEAVVTAAGVFDDECRPLAAAFRATAVHLLQHLPAHPGQRMDDVVAAASMQYLGPRLRPGAQLPLQQQAGSSSNGGQLLQEQRAGIVKGLGMVSRGWLEQVVAEAVSALQGGRVRPVGGAWQSDKVRQCVFRVRNHCNRCIRLLLTPA
jgi:hypothetical protein